ncbi:MAG: biotin--[acetyl-CoA-carboxylase] ligase [Phycisphaerae bacterium]
MHPPFPVAHLKQALRPSRLHYFPRLSSTSDHAARMRREGRLLAPAVVLTARQTRGRGRDGRTWTSPPGALAVTFAFPAEEARQPFQLALLAGLAVHRACRGVLLPNADLSLKWPNDVLLAGRKLAGVLCERQLGLDLVGIGINCSVKPADLPQTPAGPAASLLEAATAEADCEPWRVLIAVHDSLSAALAAAAEGRWGDILTEWGKFHILEGRRVSVVRDGHSVVGVVRGLDATGRLVLATDKGREAVSAGSVMPDLGQ